MRYGHQQHSEILRMTIRDMRAYAKALNELIEEEHANVPER